MFTVNSSMRGLLIAFAFLIWASPSWAQTPISPGNVQANYQQAQNRSVLTWEPRGTYRVAADITGTQTLTWRGSQVYDQRPGQNPNNWNVQNFGSAVWGKNGNELTETANQGGIWHYNKAFGWSDYNFSFQFRTLSRVGGQSNTDDDPLGITWRYTDRNNYYALYLCGYQRYSNCGTFGMPSGVNFRGSAFIRVRNGRGTILRSWAVTRGTKIPQSWTYNTQYTIRVLTSGNNFKVFLKEGSNNEVRILNYTESNANNLHAKGTFGTFSVSQPHQRYDNFRIVHTESEVRGVTSGTLTTVFKSAFARLNNANFNTLLASQVTTWRNQFGFAANQVSLTRVYTDIVNQGSMFEAKPSTNGTNTTATNPASFPYGRQKANAIRYLVLRNGAQVGGILTAQTYTDNYGVCTVRPGTKYDYRVRSRNNANQTSGNSAIASVTVTNATPTITSPLSQTKAKGTPWTLDLSPFVADADSPDSRLTITEDSANVTVNGRVLTFNYPTSFVGSSQVVNVTVTDCWGAKATGVIRVTLLNSPPVITGTPPNTATMGTKYAYTVQATDPEKTKLTYTLKAGPTGAAIDASTGALSWTPGPNNGGKTFTFTVEVCDAGNPKACATQTWTVKVNNRPPVITSSAPTNATASKAYTYAVKASDPDGDTLTYSLPTKPAGASINASTGAISWTPAHADAGKTVGFQVRVCDSSTPPACVTQSWSVKVSAANNLPQIAGVPPTQLQDGQTMVYAPTVVDSDLPNDTHTWKLDKGPAGAKFDTKTGRLEWTPTATDVGKEIEFSVTVCDKAGSCATQTWKVKVIKGNNPPLIVGTPSTTATPSTVYTYTPSVQDNDPGDTHTWKLDKGPAGANVDPSTGALSWTPAATDAGKSFDFSVTVCDKAGSCATQTWKVNVSSLNTPPQISGSPGTSGAVGQAYTYAPKVVDPDKGDTHSWTLVNGPSGATADASTGAVSWTPAAADNNKESTFELRVCDDKGACATQIWKVRVGSGNKAPVLTGVPSTVAQEETAYTYAPKATDPEGGALTWSLKGGPNGASVDPTTGALSWTPPKGSGGQVFPFEIEVCDAQGSCVTQKWLVKVTSTGTGNTPPRITTTPSTNGTSGKAYTYAPKVDDPDAGDTQTWTLPKGPNGAKIDATTGAVSWTPAAADVGKEIEFEVKVCDKAGDCATQTWKVKVVQGNNPPQITGTPSTLATTAKQYVFAPGVNDPDVGDTHTWKLLQGPVGVSAHPTNGAVIWQPKAADVGKTYDLELEVCDQGGLCAQRKWKVFVTTGAVNTAPVITSSPVTAGQEGTPYNYMPVAVDPDYLDILTWTLVKGPAGASVDPKTGEVSWTPGAADVGKDVEFTIRVCDKAGSCTTQTWKVTVAKGNRAPVFTSQPPKTAYTGEPVEYTPTITDDPGDKHTWSFDQAPPAATIDPSTGKVTWNPGKSDADKPVTFVVKVCDDGTPKQCSTQTFTLTPRQKCKVDIDCGAPNICIADADGETVCREPGCADQSPKCTGTGFCQDGSCHPNSCLTKTCAADTACRPSDGKCVPSCAGVKCQAGERCVDGACVGNACSNGGVACKADEVCDESDVNNPKCVQNPCNGQACRHGRVCDPERCIDDPCAGMKCPTDQRCLAGQCVDLLPCNVDINCPGDEICLAGKCRPAGCHTNACAAGQVCLDSACKDNECPTPGGKACGPDEFCRPASNACVPTCANANCPAGESCVDGKCAADPCANKTCNVGEVCIKGDCKTDYCAGGNKCKHGRICSTFENACLTDPCAGVTCPGQLVCVNGQCLDNTCQFDKDCPGDELCVQKQCTKVTCTQDSDCASGELCVEGTCATNACENKTCASGQACRNGQCVGSCAGVFCASGEVCVDGACTKDPCSGVTCQADETCQNGTCVKDLCKSEQSPCKAGRVCVVETCQTEPCKGVACSNGEVCKDGQCGGDKVCEFDADCAGDAVCLDKKCQPAGCYNDNSCQDPKVCTKAACVENPCANKRCGADTTCRPTDGACVANCPKCADGEICKDGKCEADPCGGSCANDEFCDNGQCAKDPCQTQGSSLCRHKRVCDAAERKCEDDPCAGMSCPGDFVCQGGVCHNTKTSGEQTNSEKTQTEQTNDGGTGSEDGPGDGGAGDGVNVEKTILLASGGCGCQTQSPATGGVLFLLLFVLPFFLRRRKDASR